MFYLSYVKNTDSVKDGYNASFYIDWLLILEYYRKSYIKPMFIYGYGVLVIKLFPRIFFKVANIFHHHNNKPSFQRPNRETQTLNHYTIVLAECASKEPLCDDPLALLPPWDVLLVLENQH